jgi:rRNA maturation RNase YbeY
VKENANDNNVNELDELFRVIIHGTLHLVGFEDGTEVLKKDMQKHENQYLSLICST